MTQAMHITGTYREGKVYAVGARWARVLVTHLSDRTLVTVAYGRTGKAAHESESCGNIRTADTLARQWITDGI